MDYTAVFSCFILSRVRIFGVSLTAMFCWSRQQRYGCHGYRVTRSLSACFLGERALFCCCCCAKLRQNAECNIMGGVVRAAGRMDYHTRYVSVSEGGRERKSPSCHGAKTGAGSM